MWRCQPHILASLHLLLLHLHPAACELTELTELTELRLLVLSPYPSEQFPSSVVGWTGGLALYPAAQLAADMINNRTDILPLRTIQLINADSGCALAYRATVTFARERQNAKRSRKPFIGIVGPACIPAAMEIGGITVAEYADVASITIATGPLTTNFTNMFRLYTSAIQAAEAMFQLVKHAQWTSVAALVDFSHWYYPQIYDNFGDFVANSSNVSVELLNFHSDVSSIRNRYNVILVFAGTQRSAETLCIARNLGFTFPNYQWIFVDVQMERLLQATHNREVYNCTMQEEAADQAIIINPRLVPENKESTDTFSGLSYNEFLNTSQKYYSRHLIEENISDAEVPIGSEDWAAGYFDSVWAFALAFDKGLQEVEGTQNSLPTSTVHKHLLALNFSGLTGNIHFHQETLEVPHEMTIYQLDKEKPSPRKIGIFYKGSLDTFDSATFVQPIKRELIVVSTVAAAIFFSSGILIFAVIAGVHLIYILLRHNQSIRAKSPHFVHTIFSGCYLFVLAALLDTVRTANWTEYSDIESAEFIICIGTLCNAIYWCLTLGTALIFGTMLVLSWRIYRIFSHYLHPGKMISDPVLAGMVGLLAMIHVTVLTAWSYHDPLLVNFELADEGIMAGVLPIYQHCSSGHFFIWLLLWLLDELIIALVVVLSILNRHVPKKDYINNTKSYTATVYIMSFINGICWPIYFSFDHRKNTNVPYVFFQILTLGSPLSALLLLFLPPLIPLFRSKAKYHHL